MSNDSGRFLTRITILKLTTQLQVTSLLRVGLNIMQLSDCNILWSRVFKCPTSCPLMISWTLCGLLHWKEWFYDVLHAIHLAANDKTQINTSKTASIFSMIAADGCFASHSSLSILIQEINNFPHRYKYRRQSWRGSFWV